MADIEQLMRQVEQYRVEEMKIVEALRISLAPVWIDAYGSMQAHDSDGLNFESFIATVLDALPMRKDKIG